MRWRQLPQSENVEVRRGARGPVMIGGAGLLIIMVLGLLFNVDVTPLLQQMGNQQMQNGGADEPQTEEEKELTQFMSHVLGSADVVWTEQFREMGRQYSRPKLVIFPRQVESACGMASAAVGPFYCPLDRQVYLDLSFFQELANRFGAPGDFAQAYVLAHEIGHHVQNQLGITDQVHSARGRVSEAEYNDLSVRLELQADFLAGVWAHHAQRSERILEPGDLEEALRAASAIGDDRLQMEAQGYAVPDSFTHGTSEQRVRWFSRGFKTGNLDDGDTFNAREL